jgi:DNA processing protein
VYPSSSVDVFEGAVATGGAVISLERWGAQPRRYAFPKRNSIIAALSSCLFVTEAGMRSGTMSTADVAVELGRKVYGIPGSIFSPLSAGTNWLISEGARVICDEASLEAAISLDYGRLRFTDAPGRPEDIGRVLSALVASPSRADDLAARLGEGVITVLSALSDYEAAGVVTKLPDGRYAPTREFYLSHNGPAATKGDTAGAEEEHGPDS